MSVVSASCGRGSLTFQAWLSSCLWEFHWEFNSCPATTLAVKKLLLFICLIIFFCHVYFIYARYIVWHLYLYNFVVITADKAAKEK